jgi:hypothetical protein
MYELLLRFLIPLLSLYYSMLSRPFSLYVASSHVLAMTLMDWHLCIYSYGRIILAIAFCFSVLLQPIPGPQCVLRFREARQHFFLLFMGGEWSGSYGLGGVSDFSIVNEAKNRTRIRIVNDGTCKHHSEQTKRRESSDPERRGLCILK